ncbi:hypothetical protein [Wolbachia endosymbiont (group A) of Agelastica alni]|uniref:hypothetical protein n=1 Tax=Wolbachia endosymbiont (group A) of Agelastica alni TaxID=3066130 RepID=UPI003341C8FC
MHSTDKLSALSNNTLGELIAELNNKFVKTDGSNITTQADKGKALVDVLVPALATVGTDDTKKVYTKGTADTSFVKTDGSNISTQADKGKALVDVLVPALATVGTDDTKKVYTKSAAETALADKVNVTGDNATDDGVNAMLDKLTNKVAKIDGSNVTEAGAKAILGQLKGNDQVAKIDGSNVTKDGVTAMLGKLTDEVVKTSELKTKAAAKDVLDAITASSDFTNKVYIKADQADEVYTKTAADAAFVKATELKTKAAAKDVLDAITASSDFTNKVYIKADQADEVYTKTAADAAFVKATELKTKAAAKDVLDAIFDAKDGNNKISETKIGATFAKTTDLNNKVNVAGDNATDAGVTAMLGKLIDANKVLKVDGSNVTEAGAKAILGQLKGNDQVAKIDGSNATDSGVTVMLNKLADKVVQTSQLETLAVAEKVLGAKDGNKSILVDKLGRFLDNSTDNKYGVNSDQTAKAFLAAKGMTPTAAEIADQPALQAHAAQIKISSPEFKRAVQEEMSQPKFDIPASDDVALDWTW